METPDTTRRRLLRGAVASGLLGGAMGAAAADEQEPFDDAVGELASATGEASELVYPPTIETIRSPLAMNPAIHEGRETLRIELDADVDVDHPQVTIRPTFGDVRPEVELDAVVAGTEPSELWLDLGSPEMTVVEATLPPVAATPSSQAAPVAPGLYDVTVSWDDGDAVDSQPRSLSLRESFPDDPRIYVVSDAHAGDPRALETGIQESADEGDLEPFFFRFENVIGGPDTERWGGFRRAVAEVSALDPDLVVFPGDLAFGQDIPKKFYQEYADAYAMLSALDAPVYTALGNHDGYVQGTTDGKEIYRNVIGPWYWSRELRPGFRLTCFDTYDWRELDRLGATYGVSAWGGQVRDEQLERLEAVLSAWYDPDADQTHVSFGHHQPAWRQDEGNPTDESAEGIPVAEQLARGAGDFVTAGTGGQAWRGSGRLETRALVESFDTVLHVAGHAHRDRLSRAVAPADGDGVGDVVYTPTGAADLGRYTPTNETITDEYSQFELESELLEGSGTLYVDTTTAGSGTSQYWGWRAFDVTGEAIDPSSFGYQPDDPAEFIEDRTVDPESWPHEHVRLGRYSAPTFGLAVEALETDDDAVSLRVRNDLESDLTGTLLVSLPFVGRPRVDGGDLQWRRADDDRQDVSVAYEVPPESDIEIRLSPGR